MDVDVLDAGGADPAATAAALRALVPGGADVADGVAAILAEVRERGDAAVLDYTHRHDGPATAVEVTEAELDAAVEGLDPEVRSGLELAIANVGRVAAAGLRLPRVVDLDTHEVFIREVPLDRAGIYVPGGRAPYPSTVVMGVVTARTAGVRDVVVASPPRSDGRVHPTVLAAARLCRADRVYAMGGAQAVAALAHGTETVAPVDVICGPGNLWVQEAKRQVNGTVAIDSFAGPSDLFVLLDLDPDSGGFGRSLEAVALDLLAQAEHGAGSLVVAAMVDERVLEALEIRLAGALDGSAAVARLVRVTDLDAGVALAQAFAPEHLELIGPGAVDRSDRITHAGCVFLDTGTAFGDYVAGSNHTLPTGGAARFASALGPWHFRRSYTEVVISRPDALAAGGAAIARAEGFELHAASMEARIGENPR